MTIEEVLKLFTYHAPLGDQPTRYEKIRAKARELAREIMACCPRGRDRDHAIDELRGAVMWANAAIALGQPTVDWSDLKVEPEERWPQPTAPGPMNTGPYFTYNPDTRALDPVTDGRYSASPSKDAPAVQHGVSVCNYFVIDALSGRVYCHLTPGHEGKHEFDLRKLSKGPRAYTVYRLNSVSAEPTSSYVYVRGEGAGGEAKAQEFK